MYKIFSFSLLFVFSIMLAWGCNGSKKGADTNASKDYMIYDKIIVQLDGGVKPEQIVEKHRPSKLELVKAVSAVMNMWLFTYDMDEITPEKMLKALKETDGVKEAEFDKKLGPRGGR